ncbi:craniofacial development protein 2-like [Melitaea cinxia]|uniref:craniofacial development protein 2-like n=1 Tax=Melitaea cinxia TaxID=113334 RepID=UPI001E26F6F4|nr:craniofacial development protein 2-like [Melitaea cinxia]
MSSGIKVCDNVRAYPAGDAQMQHPASVGNGQGLLHQGRGQRKRRVQEVNLRIASWNVGTMTGRGRELADVLERRRINIACLQETKWKGQRAREIGAGYKFYYCGCDGKRNGVGIVLDRELKNKVTDVNRVNDRVIVVRLLMEDSVLNIVSVYAPQTGCDDSMKERFWEDFDAVIMRVPECEEIYIGGDFNGHVGRMNDGYERVHGGRGHGVRNRDGEALLEAALAFDLAIANTFYQKREQHLVTYRSGLHSTQIDYILLRRNRLKSAKDCKVIPSESLVSQHRLLLLDLTLRVQSLNKSPKPPVRTKWYRLDDRKMAAEFRERVIGKLIEMGDMVGMGVNECWREMATWVRSVARDVLGETKGKRKIERDTWWWNEEAKKAVAIARAKVQDKLYDSLESPQGQKNLFRIAREREMNARDVNHMKCIKDEAGKILTDNEEIKERWKRYFNSLMNEENEWSGVLENVRSNEGMVKEVSIEEVKMAVQSMKNGKAVGPDGIPAEVWKAGNITGKDVVYRTEEFGTGKKDVENRAFVKATFTQ